MRLTLRRKWYSDKSTIGEISIDGMFECHTLEDTVRKDGIKVYGKTAIPTGSYEVVITFSDRFRRPMPLLLDVPGFEGIRIHSGNTEADTLGCLLVGKYESDMVDHISDSRLAFGALFPKLEAGLKTGKAFIDIINN